MHSPDTAETKTGESAPGPGGADPMRIPDHELLRVIGRGSYGEVWEARNIMGAPRAVKIVRRQDFQCARPFEREFEGIQKYEPLSRSHSGLMQVLHIGMSPQQDYFYYVMELADAESPPPPGGPIYVPRTLRSDLLRRGTLPPAECVETGITLATALGHLHRSGLVHRDVKPSNIIFVAGTPKLADVGLVTEMGETGSLVGTEGYLAPEGMGKPSGDVYSLGKVLYECVTGNDRNRFPDVPDDWNDSSASRAGFEFLEIVLRAAERNPERRYPGMDEMLADLALLQAGKSVRNIRRMETRLRRTLQVLAIAASACAMVGGGWFYERQQRNKIARAEQIARQATDETRQLLGTSVVAEARAVRQGGRAGSRERALQAVARGLAVGADAVALRGEAASALALTDIGEFSAAIPESRTPATHTLWSDDGRTLVSKDADGTVSVRSREGDETVLRATLALPRESRIAAVSRTGETIAVDGPQGTLSLWSIAEKRRLWETAKPVGATAIAFAFGGDWLAVSGSTGLTAYSMADAEGIPLVPDAPTARSLCIAPDESWIATLPTDAGDTRICLYRNLPGGLPGTEDAGAIVETEIPSAVRLGGLSISGDSHFLAAALAEDSIRVWELASLEEIATLRGHQRSVRGTAFHPGDSSILASTSWDGTTRLWSIPANRELLVAPTGGENVRLLPGRGEILLQTWDGSAVKSAPLSPAAGLRLLIAPAELSTGLFSGIAFSPDGHLLAAAGDAGVVVWNLETGQPTAVHGGSERTWLDVSFSPDGNYLWCSGRPGLFRHPIRRITATGEVEFSAPETLDSTPSGHFQWLGDTQKIAVIYRSGAEGAIRILDSAGKPEALFRQSAFPDRLACSPDGRWIAAAFFPDPGGVLWDLNATPPTAQRVAADGRTAFGFFHHLPLLMVGTDREIRFVPLPLTGSHPQAEAPGNLPRSLPRWHAEFVPGRSAESVPAGLVAFTTSPSSLTLCDARTLETLAVLDSPLTSFDSVVSFSPDGSRLALAGGVNRVAIWDVAWLRQELAQRGLGW